MSETERKHRSRNGRFSVLALLGAILIGIGLIGLYTGPDLLQYAFLPEKAGNGSAASAPSSGNESSLLEEDPDSDADADIPSGQVSVAPTSPLREALRDYAEIVQSSVWAGEDLRMTIHGQISNASVYRESGGTAADVRVILAGPRYSEVFPREILEGNALSDAEISNHRMSVVLDSRLAFTLFRDTPPIGETVQIESKTYTVVGIVRYSRSLGASNELTAWVPLGADDSLSPDLLTVSVRHSQAGDGFTTLWQSETRQVFGSGTFISLPREKTRASMFPRLMVFFFAVLLMKKWISLLRQWGRLFLDDARCRISRQYAWSLAGYFALRVLAALLLGAVTLAAMYALAVFITQPLLVFPEWVPEKPVAMSSILARFWSLITENAAPVVFVTEEAALLRFWHFLIRLGTFLFLLGLVSRLRRNRPEKSSG